MINEGRIYLDKDTRLMIKASEGDEKAFTEIYTRYFSVAASFISSLDGQFQISEDIARDVFMRIWDNCKEYHPSSTLKTFLFTYARNIFCGYKSKKNKEKALFVADSNIALGCYEGKDGR